MKPTAPNPNVTSTSSHTSGLSRLQNMNTPSSSEKMISTPPMVGVPAFLPCISARSGAPLMLTVRMGWPALSRRSAATTHGPALMDSSSASAMAAAALTVMYWKGFT